MKRVRKEIEWKRVEWLDAEIKIDYDVEERYRTEEGHGQHFIDESERTLVSAVIYIAGNTIDITEHFKQIEAIL